MKAWLLFPLLFTLLSFQGYAEQKSFNRKKNDQGYQFNYRWLDANQQEQNIAFTLSQEFLFDQFRGFRAFKPEQTHNAIQKSILKAWQKQPIDKVNISVAKQSGRYVLSLSSDSQKSLSQGLNLLKSYELEARKNYLNKNFYHEFTSPDGVKAIKPDHVRIANASVPYFKAVKPIILETVSIQNIREVTNYVLGFVQSIPYATLTSRTESSGAGFNPPAKLLWENQGDCDSKVTLMASMLRNLMPRIKIALVFIDNHALIGIDIPAKGGESTVNLQGTSYVLAEPTGPAKYPLGHIAPESKVAIDSHHYVLEPLIINSANVQESQAQVKP